MIQGRRVWDRLDKNRFIYYYEGAWMITASSYREKLIREGGSNAGLVCSRQPVGMSGTRPTGQREGGRELICSLRRGWPEPILIVPAKVMRSPALRKFW